MHIGLVSGILCASTAFGASVLDFGAQANGSADDSGAIQAAVNATNSGTLTFPEGTYRISKSITLKSNVTYQGSGNAVLAAAANGTPIFVLPGSGANNITISGLTFDGGQIRSVGQTPSNIKITGNTFRNLTTTGNGNWTLQSAIISINGLINSSIDHNLFSNLMINGRTRPDGTLNSIDQYNAGITMYGLDRTSIVYNTFDTVGQGIKVCFSQSYAASNAYIAYNKMEKIHRMGMELQDGVGCGMKNLRNPVTTNLTIEYNDIHLNNDPYWSTFGVSVAMPPNKGARIRNNKIVGEEPLPGLAKAGTAGYGIEMFGSETEINNNAIQGWYAESITMRDNQANSSKVFDNYACSFGNTTVVIGVQLAAVQVYNNTVLRQCPATGVPNPITMAIGNTAE